MKLSLTAAILTVLANAAAVTAQPANVPFNPLLNVSNTAALRSDLADISMSGATTYVVWVEENAAGQQVRLRRSNTGGASFIDGTSGRVITSIDAAETIYSLRIVATGSGVYLLYTCGVEPRLAKARLAHSADGGATFSTPVTLAEGPELGGSPFADVAVDGNGAVHVVLESRDGGDDILHLSSIDHGATFSAPVPLAASEGVPSLRPRVAARGLQLAVVWEEGGDVALVYSIDGGATFGALKNLSASDAESKGPNLAISNAIHVVWTEDNSVAIRTSLDGNAFTATQALAMPAAGEQFAGTALGSSLNNVHVSWITAAADGVTNGPFYRRSIDGGGSFAAIQDLRLGGAGRPFGVPAIANFNAARIVWPNSPSGFAPDADVHTAVEPNCVSAWKAPVSGNWNDASKWSPAVVPNGGNACIMADGAPYTVTVQNGMSATDLTIGHGTSTHRPTVRFTGSFVVGTSLVNSGELTFNPGAQVTANTGMIVNTERGRITTAAGAPGAFNGSVTNHGEVDLSANLGINGNSRTITNFGTFTIRPGAAAAFGGGFTFHQNGGVLNVEGKMEFSAEFSTAGDTMNFNGGEVEGTVIIQGHSRLNIGSGSVGKGTFQFERNVIFGISSGGHLSGNIAPAQTIRLMGTVGGSAQANLAAGLTNAGRIELSATATNAGGAVLAIQAGTVVNTGTILVERAGDVAVGRIDGLLENRGTFDIQDGLTFGANGRITNLGTMTIGPQAAVAFGSNYVFNQNGGVLSNAGKVEMSAEFSTAGDTFNFNDGTVEGEVLIQGHSRLNIGPGSVGAAAFAFERNVSFGASSGGHLSGNIAAAQTVRLRGTVGGTSQANVAAGFTNFGTLILESTAANAGGAALSMTAGTLINRGSLIANEVGPLKTLRGHLENRGVMTVLSPLSLQLPVGTFNNFSDLTVGPLGKITLAQNTTVTQHAGTMTLDGPIELATEFSTAPDVFNYNGGNILGAAGVHLLSTSRLNIAASAAAGAGRFVYRAPGGGTMSGNLGPQMTLRIQGSSVTVANGLTNAGNIVLAVESSPTQGASLAVTAGTLVNTGTITVEPTATVAPLNAVIENHGRITINDTINLSRANANHFNDGIIEIAQTHTLSLFGASTLRNAAPGGIGGNGTLAITNGFTFIGAGNLGVNVTNAGRFRPGASPGIINISGRYTQTSTGRLEIEIAGESAGSGYDQVNVSDLATLAGTLDVQIAPGFCIQGSYTFLTYAAVANDFVSRAGLTGSGGRSLTPSRGATAYALNTTGPGCNNAPVVVADSYSTTAGAALTVPAPGVLGNDSDAQGDSLSAVLGAGPANGALVLNSDGSFTYAPHAGFTGTDGFTYRASDGNTQSGLTAVTIAVLPAAPPIINGHNPEALIAGHVRALVISGANFSSPRVTLTKGSETVSGNVLFSTPATIQVQFDVTSVTAGKWTVVVENQDGLSVSAPIFVDPAIIFAGFTWDGVQGFPVRPANTLNRLPNYLTVFNVGLDDGMLLVTFELPHPKMRLRVGGVAQPIQTGGSVDMLVWAPRGKEVRVPLYWGIAPEFVNFPGMPEDPAKATFGQPMTLTIRSYMGLTIGSGAVTKILAKAVKAGCNKLLEHITGDDVDRAAHESASEARDEAEDDSNSVSPKQVVNKLMGKLAKIPVPGADVAAAIAECEFMLLNGFLEAWEQEIERLTEEMLNDPEAAEHMANRVADASEQFNARGAAAGKKATEKYLGSVLRQQQGEEVQLTFEQKFVGLLRAGWDPNDKKTNSTLFCQVIGTGEGAGCASYFVGPDQTAEPLEYVIQFENKAEATGPAEDIVVTDVLDDGLDPATLEVIDTSHPSTEAQPNRFTFEVVGNVLTFRFTGIDLPPNVDSPEGEGDVTFRIKPRPGLASGTTIRNSASIVFDFNPPIVTSEVVHVVDTNAPVTTATASVEPNTHGWNRTDVTVLLQSDDGATGAGVKHTLVRVNGGPEQIVMGGVASVPLTDEGVHTISYFSIDNVGNTEAERMVTVRIDKTAPIVTGARVTASNTHGWNNGPVVVSFSANDALSGVAGEPSRDVTLDTEGAGQIASAEFADLAGNSATGTVGDINIDLTPPTISATPDRAPNEHGWYNADVFITVACADALSGVDTCDPSSHMISEEGTHMLPVGTTTDRAGNIAQASAATVNIDKTAPVVSCSTTAPVLWPPNHKLTAIGTIVTVTDALSGASGFTLAAATSNEPDNGLGDGDAANDIQAFAIGTADTNGLLRAERSGRGTGRIYSLGYQGADLAGNTASCTAVVTVPHDQGGGKK